MIDQIASELKEKLKVKEALVTGLEAELRVSRRSKYLLTQRVVDLEERRTFLEELTARQTSLLSKTTEVINQLAEILK